MRNTAMIDSLTNAFNVIKSNIIGEKKAHERKHWRKINVSFGKFEVCIESNRKREYELR